MSSVIYRLSLNDFQGTLHRSHVTVGGIMTVV